MKLNVGCGNHRADGWTNMDIERNDEVKPDIQGDLMDLPDEIQGVTHVYLGHVLEHLALGTIAPALSKLWERCVPGVEIAVVGPDCDRARALDRAGRLYGIKLQDVVHGAGRWANDVHLWECTPGGLERVLRRSGVQDVRHVSITSAELSAWPVTSRVDWQCAMIASLEAKP